MKINVLKIICLLTVGYKYFVLERLPKFDQSVDQQLGKRLTERLGNYDFVMMVLSQSGSPCVEVQDETYLAIGCYLKDGLDISSLLRD
jgi:hypothetical protein